jgi:hypothetical protein
MVRGGSAVGYWIRVVAVARIRGRVVYSYGRAGRVDAFLALKLDDGAIYPCDGRGEPTSSVRLLTRRRELVNDGSTSDDDVARFAEAAFGLMKNWDGRSEPPADASRYFG